MSVTTNEKKFRDERTIQIINKYVTLNDQDIKRKNKILNEILEKVLTTMKVRDEFFRDLYQKPVYVGSYYKGTKVGKPEEFDVNIIIKIPVEYNNIKFHKAKPGYIKLKLAPSDCDTPKWNKHRKILSTWLSEEGYLNQDKFRQSMESLFARTMKNLPTISNYSVRVHKSGPAFTLLISKQGSLEMNVDLVPVLELSCKPPLPIITDGYNWYAVPKPMKNVATSHLYWRMSFYNDEKNMLTKHGNLKPVIRQIKKLRDQQQWSIIPSYHIETLFMHFIRNVQKNSESSANKLTGTKLFIHMLEELKHICKMRYLENFWVRGHNLIEADANQLEGVVGRLTKIIKDITKDPVKMADWLLTAEELTMCRRELNAIRNFQDADDVATSQQMTQENEGDSLNNSLISIYNVGRFFYQIIEHVVNRTIRVANEQR